ncbi:MAG: putative rane protein, partial [Paenibacillus sp.]|nr:putative rane protein [Paenibacillus sp.]
MLGIRLLWPSSLKNRLFVSILLFVLVPSSILQIRNISQLETLMKENISQQNSSQLDSLKSSFENVKIAALGAMLQLEREPEVRDRLIHPDLYSDEERILFLQNKLYTAKHSLMIGIEPIHLTLTDRYGHVYTTLTESVEQRVDTSQQILDQPEFSSFIQSGESYVWAVHDSKDLLEKAFPNSRLYSQFSKLETVGGETFAYLRISLNIKSWLTSITNGFQVKQAYYIMNGQGDPVLQIEDMQTETQLHEMLPRFKSSSTAYYADDRNLFIYNGTYLRNTDWYLVARFPLEALSGNIRSMKSQVIISLTITAIVFIIVTFALVSAIVRPLRKLQIKMTELVDRNLDVRIPEKQYKGELLNLAQA